MQVVNQILEAGDTKMSQCSVDKQTTVRGACTQVHTSLANVGTIPGWSGGCSRSWLRKANTLESYVERNT